MYRQRKVVGMMRLVALVCLVALSWGCGPGYAPEMEAAGLENAPEPDKAGPFSVGVRTIRVVDSSRKTEIYPEGRPMVIEIWYPAQPSEEGAAVDVYDPGTDAPQELTEKIKNEGIEIPKLSQEAYRDAKPYKKGGPYPLILFSHGSGGIRYQSVFQTPHLASHGYVVVSVDHVDNTLYDILAGKDGRDPGILLQSSQDRPLDMVFMREEMKRRNADSTDPLFEMVDDSRVGITGHSFGGFTSILTPRVMSDIKVSIPQAPFTSLFEGLEVTPQHLSQLPIMVLASKEDKTLDYAAEQKGFYDKMVEPRWFRAPRYLVTFEKGGHFTFSNMCDLDLSKFALKLGFSSPEALIEDGCSSTANIPPAEGHRLTNYYSTAMFNVLLRGSEKSRDFLKQLDGSGATFEVKMP